MNEMSTVKKKGIKDDQEVWGRSHFVRDSAIYGDGEDWGPRERGDLDKTCK